MYRIDSPYLENRNIAKSGSTAVDDSSTPSTSSSSSSSNDEDSEIELEPRSTKKRRGERRRDRRDTLREKDEESGGILNPVSNKQHEEARQRSLDQRYERKQGVDFRLSDKFSVSRENY